MWRDYCTRLKERSSGMGALKNDDVLYGYIARVNTNVFQPQKQVIFPAYSCSAEEDIPSETQIIWSPLYEVNELKADEFKVNKALPAGWRTAEQKMLEMNAIPGTLPDNTVVISSCSSNSDEENIPKQTVYSSAKCLLHMKDITDSQEYSRNLEFDTCGICENIILEDYNMKNCSLEHSLEESTYQSCSGDGSVCSSGIGRGKLNKRESYKEDTLLSEIGADTSKLRTNKCRKPVKVEKNNINKARKAVVREKSNDSNKVPKTWNSSTKAPVQRIRKKEDVEKQEKKDINLRNNNNERKPHWCLHKKHNPCDDVASAGSTTVEEDIRIKSSNEEDIPIKNLNEDDIRRKNLNDQNAEIIATLAEMNTRELRALQCSAAIMRHNLGVLRDDVKGLRGCLDGKKPSYSWWTLFKDFVVAAGLVSGAFGLRQLLDMLKRSARYGVLKRVTNKQEKMVLAAFVLTVGARFGKQLWQEQGNARWRREKRLREQLCRIDESVCLMSGLTTPEATHSTDSE